MHSKYVKEYSISIQDCHMCFTFTLCFYYTFTLIMVSPRRFIYRCKWNRLLTNHSAGCCHRWKVRGTNCTWCMYANVLPYPLLLRISRFLSVDLTSFRKHSHKDNRSRENQTVVFTHMCGGVGRRGRESGGGGRWEGWGGRKESEKQGGNWGGGGGDRIKIGRMKENTVLDSCAVKFIKFA